MNNTEWALRERLEELRKEFIDAQTDREFASRMWDRTYPPIPQDPLVKLKLDIEARRWSWRVSYDDAAPGYSATISIWRDSAWRMCYSITHETELEALQSAYAIAQKGGST